MVVDKPFCYSQLNKLQEDIASRNLELGTDDSIAPLLEPVKVGGFHLPNRLVVLPMEGCDGRADGSPDELTFRRYRRFASGGAGLLWVEATAVVEEGRANPRQLWIRRETLESFRALVREALAAAPKRPYLVLQLTHSGRYSKPGRAPRPIIAHRSPYLDPLHKLPPDYPVISDGDLERLEDRYVEAAKLAREAGFDAVDVKACHRYLISELHASHTREGRYGGSFENRTRFFRNVVGKIRAAAPGIAVTSRMNAYDAMAYPYGFGVDREDAARPDLREPIELVRFLKESGAPLVNITIGNPYYNPNVNRPFDWPVIGAPTPKEAPIEGVARFIGIVRRIQEAVPDLAVIGGGYSWLRQFFPHVAAAAVRRGWVTLVGLGRLSFAYPDFPRALEESGRLDPEKVCVACSACTQIMRDGGRAGCVPRDSAIYEPIYKAGRAEALDAILEMARACRQCNDPTCVSGCPAHVHVPEFVGQIATSHFREAYETLRAGNVLAAICGYVCPAGAQCEGRCINQHYDEAVPIRHLQRWISRKALEEGWAAEPRSRAPATGKRIAVLGGGPAGVAAAVTLASLGHEVCLMESAPAWGGQAEETIPEERLPVSIVEREIQSALDSSGVAERRRNVRIGRDFTLDDVMREGFDAALIALGLSRSVDLPGVRPVSGVEGALDFLASVKRGRRIQGTVLVLGGGSTAMDAALAAQRAGASDVSIIYRRSFTEMPAYIEEREAAIRASVHLFILTAPLEYLLDKDGSLSGIKVARTRLGALDESGRRRPEVIPGSEHTIPADLVVEAIGQQVGEELTEALSGLKFTQQGRLWTRERSFETSRPGVFAAGDIVNGGATVVEAVAEGSCAAREIDEYVRSRQERRWTSSSTTTS